jgi:uncharacterized membrane protein YccF (DUF307 family)
VRTILNIIWFVLAGLWLALAYGIAGLILCITIIGIPFGVQSFKLAGYALWPFGRVLVPSPTRLKGLSVVANILWFILAGWWLALAHLLTGILLCLTSSAFPLVWPISRWRAPRWFPSARRSYERLTLPRRRRARSAFPAGSSRIETPRATAPSSRHERVQSHRWHLSPGAHR